MTESAHDVLADAIMSVDDRHLSSNGLADAYMAALAAAGYAVVPIAPTEEMMESAAKFGGRGGYNRARGFDEAPAIWRDMLAASPKP